MPVKRHLKYIILFVSILGNVVLFAFWRISAQETQNPDPLKGKYSFIAEGALRNDTSDVITNFLPLREQIDTEVKPYKNSIAFYFEYLPSGTSIGVNEDNEFTAASLLKVPVVMAYFHMKERLGITEDKTVVIQESQLNSDFGDLYKRGANAKINLKEAVSLALQESDNTASLILADQISNEDFQFVYEGLDIPMIERDGSPLITAQQYTSILKALYYSSVLNTEDSQTILTLLTKTKFKDMLPRGVPKDVSVAHKIGLINDEIYQDCGIVYVPDRPYILCMISKSDRKTAVVRMERLSKLVYNYVKGLQK